MGYTGEIAGKENLRGSCIRGFLGADRGCHSGLNN